MDGSALTQQIFYDICRSPSQQKKGNIDQEKKKIQPTRVNLIKNEETLEYRFQEKEPTTKHECGAVLTPFSPKERVYAHLTGVSPIKSSRGNQYMIVVYDFDINNILVKPLRNKQAGIIKTAWSLINYTLPNSGVMPKRYILNNEASLVLEAAITKKA